LKARLAAIECAPHLFVTYTTLVPVINAAADFRDRAAIVRNARSWGGDYAGRNKRGDDSDGPKFQHDLLLVITRSDGSPTETALTEQEVNWFV
jgi:hypothetical protein